jgi:chemotaxis protein methyltransferase CheR
MRPTVFRALRDLAYQQAGISLGEEKLALVSARVGKRLRALSLDDEEAYLHFLQGDKSGNELVEFLDVISTNFTSFFREPPHFEWLQKSLQAMLDGGQRQFRVWCAASSSGEEPYTLALVLSALFEGRGVDWKVLATDISTKVLGMAKKGHYTQAQLKAVPREALNRHFVRLDEERRGEPLYAVGDQLKRQVTFARLNLARPPYPMRGPFDAVFCRNVMIYFDAPVRQGLTREMERLARPGALVVVGHAETLSGLDTRLELVSPSVYRSPSR